MRSSGLASASSSMNDFPIPELPPVITATANGARAFLFSNTGVSNLAVRIQNKEQKRNMKPAVTSVHEVIVSGIHIELTPSLKGYVTDKMQRLFAHQDHIVRIRVDIEFDDRKSKDDRFTAKARMEIHGPDSNISVTSDDAYKSVDLLVDKLDRQLQRRARMHKEKRNHPHAVELGVALPKAS